ncbi:MAG: iron-containing redox enzyme family protein [Halieaceae bacterium]|jgi:pyrroloquinoline quinone (PQQ) biosynthesis protein C|nr:iron-containing redox enzyme family protein [Gammaproteobacteria bacterium]MBT4519312.1 iron-containing redox enzyme family protein [Halieaceae bacterium]
MRFFDELQAETSDARERLLGNSLVRQALAGDMSSDGYVAFLCQAFHHVRHTTPLLMAAGARMSVEKEWLRTAMAQYVEEELGHQEWILNDIAASGYDADVARHSRPNPETELMVAYAYYLIDRVNPVAFLGMVHVLEGTSTDIAIKAADCIAGSTDLPKAAFSYLRSHGALDVSHVEFFEKLLAQIDEPGDQSEIIHASRMFYRLYGDVFSSVDPAQARPLRC